MKKLIHVLTLSTFVGQSVLLTGCVGENSTSNSNPTAANSLQAANKSLKDAFSDSNLWTNIVANDSQSIASNEDFVVNNHTDNDIEFVGCDSTDDGGTQLNDYLDYSKMHDIPANFSFPRTNNLDSRWISLSDGTTIYDPTHITDYSIHFNKIPTAIPNRTFACYYKVDLPDHGDGMYIKLVNNFYYFTTYQMGQTLPFQPQKDQAQVQQESWKGQLASYLTSGGLTIAAAGGSYYAYNKLRIPAQDYLEAKIKAGLRKQASYLNECISNYCNNPVNGAYKYSRITVNDNSYNIEKFAYEKDMDGKFKLILYANPINDAQSVKFDLTINNDIVAQLKQTNSSFKNLLSLTSPMKVAEDNDISGLDNGSLFDLYIKAGIEDPELGKIIAKSYRTTMTEIANNSSKVLAIEGAFNFAFDALLWTVITPLINSIYGIPAVGAFDTTVNHVYFDSITQADVDKFNSTHDQNHQIKANTKYTNLTNSSIHQKGRFTFNDSSQDQQYAVDIDLSSLTTPWVRQDANYQSDPFLSCISKNDCGPSNPTHKGDAVVQMDITDNEVSSTMDLDYLYNLGQNQSLGINELGVDNRLPAPSYQLNSITDTVQHKEIYALNRANNGLMKTGPSLIKFGNISGLVLNQNQEATLGMAIPTDQLNGQQLMMLTESKPLVGGGFGVSFVGNDESGEVDYLPVKSDSLKQLYDSESNVPPYLYSKFACSFPTTIGTNCPLTLSIGGNNDGKHHLGKLYIADASSKTTVIPVYVNYRLLSEPFSFSLNQGDAGLFRLSLANFGNQDYDSIQINGLPTGATIVNNSCSNGLAVGAQCELDFNLSQVIQGNYSVVIAGISSSAKTKSLKLNDIPEADQESLTINVQHGWRK